MTLDLTDSCWVQDPPHKPLLWEATRSDHSVETEVEENLFVYPGTVCVSMLLEFWLSLIGPVEKGTL